VKAGEGDSFSSVGMYRRYYVVGKEQYNIGMGIVHRNVN